MAMARAIDARACELARALPRVRGAGARERALAVLAICVGGLTLARAMRGHPASDEVLSACRKLAAPGRRRRARKPAR
jgi:TetR/AcrR family transcriptional repressor of nem operon